MKTISLKGSAMPKIASWSLIREQVIKFNVEIASIAGAISFLGCLADSDAAMYAGAFIAMFAIKYYDKKGGAK